ncbi:NAD(P)-binding protein [Terfezia boudieri ATCC MYA-4762]|uniref:NAD(P)-binding protein n=1 Tax=Terfezia boudieri ATCC MYA-4762 TaxID=1051890 RepID=A0A3N4LXF0_9PEZI|nr:NAD(P)-binding protein [Terfezia boudieri ATCC MYA-4762]
MPKLPKVWLITSATSPLGYSVALRALQDGDFVALGCRRDEVAADLGFALQTLHESDGRDSDGDFDMSDTPNPSDKRLIQQISLSRLHTAFPSHTIIVELDTRSIPLCHSSLSQTVAAFGRVDVMLVCSTKTYVGCIEEIPLQSVVAQFEAATFGPMNVVRAALPVLRRQRSGHVLVVTGVTGGMGTPALGLRCAADHAIEGFCDALAYEVAPFGVRVSVVQPPIEVNVLSNPLTIFPEHPSYKNPPFATSTNGRIHTPVTFMRNLISTMHPATTIPTPISPSSPPNTTPVPAHHTPPTSLLSLASILAETVHIITSISGLDDPPGRIVVGSENAEQVKERLKAVSEELEDFLEVSVSVDAKGPLLHPISLGAGLKVE